jgi:integrase
MHVKPNLGWLAISHIPLHGEFVTQRLHLTDTRDNRREAKLTLKALESALRAGTIEIEFAKRFPNSRVLKRLGLKASKEQTLGEFAKKWLAEKKPKLTKSSHYDYNSLLKAHILPHTLASMPLSQINDGHINLFIGDIQRKTKPPKKVKRKKRGAKPEAPPIPPQPISARRVNMALTPLRGIFETARRRSLIPVNPMDHVENLREEHKRADPFDFDETRRIIEAAGGWERTLVTVLLYTGMRPGEAIALHWDAIDWDHGLILVRWTQSRRYGRGLPKTKGSERDVEMIAPVRNALRDQRARSQLKGDLVFPSLAGKAIDLANFRARNWPRILQRAKVRPRTLYQCRHSFVRLAIEFGDTPQHIADQLGHTSLEMFFRVYSKWMKKPPSRLAELEKAITQGTPKIGGETAGSHGK